MMTVHEVSEITGVSIRALHHYDRIGLLPATEVTEKGYRLYDDTALERLSHILLFKELQFPLKDIKEILDSPGFDRTKALEQQIALLKLRREHIDNLIFLASGIKETGVKHMDFTAFDTGKMDEYARQAKETWGKTPEYREFEERSEGRSKEEEKSLGILLMQIFARIGEVKDGSPDAPEAQALVREIQQFITDHYYTCSDEIFSSLGQAYGGGGPMNENIDRAGGEGTGEFARKAIEVYLKNKNG